MAEPTALRRFPNVDVLADRAYARPAPPDRAVKVGSDLRSVTNRRVYAVGDAAGGMQFTHVAGYHAGVVIRSILGADPGTDVLEEGDLVVEVNRRPTPNVTAYRRALSELPEGESAWLYVYRPHPSGAFLTRLEVHR